MFINLKNYLLSMVQLFVVVLIFYLLSNDIHTRVLEVENDVEPRFKQMMTDACKQQSLC